MQSYSAEGRTEEGHVVTSTQHAEEWRRELATRGLALIGLYCSSATTPTITSTAASTIMSTSGASPSASPSPGYNASPGPGAGASPGANAGAGAGGASATGAGGVGYNNRLVDRPRRHLLKTTHFNR